jgi:hemerythrin-like domain-containing protein
MTDEATSSGILRNEHAAIAMVLDSQEVALSALERGIAVDPGIFADLHQFFSLFIGQCHHGKEEQLLFPILRRSPALGTSIDQLEKQHLEGRALEVRYDVARRQYAAHGLAKSAQLIGAARAYAAFLRRHITLENESVLEPAAQVISSTEEAAMVSAFDRFEEDVMGKGTHERLHAMIETLGPRLKVYE